MTNSDSKNDQTKSHVIQGIDPVIHQYRLVGRLGSGGMGEVFLAEDTSLKRFVALKFMGAEHQNNAELRTRFVREAQAAAKLSHPNIVTIHEVAEHNGRPFFSMEHVEGESLKTHAGGRKLSTVHVLDLITQVASGLQEAHRLGVIHRDIKPANILIDKSGRARIVDFGLAALVGSEQITQIGSTLGTIGYMSPEQVRGEPADERSDLFSLGVVSYELLTGRRPFRADNEAAVLYAIVHADPEPLAERDEIDIAPIQEIINRLLHKEPSSRFQNAGELLQGLRKLLPAGIGLSNREENQASIAVLPFSNLSADPEQEYFCDGIAEDIISDLKNINDLRVVARTSAFAFKGKNEDIRRIGRQLNVGYILEGSVRKGGARVRITAQLIEVASGYHIWSEKYDRQLQDIFAIQDDISHAIVEKLKLQLGGDRTGRRTAKQAPIEAYQLYSQGRHELNKRTAKAFTKALEFFNRSLESAPDFAQVHSGLADAYFLLFAYDLISPRDAVAQARVSARRAIALNDKLADAHATLGGILTFYDWAWQDAEVAFLKALELSPGHAKAHQWYGELLTFLGRKTEAERHLQLALRLDPLSTVVLTMLGWHYIRFGDPDTGLIHLDRAIELESQNDFTYICKAAALFALNRPTSAWELLRRAKEVSDGSTLSVAMLGHFGAIAGDVESARQTLEILSSKRTEEYVPLAYLATLQLDVGNESAATASLKEAVRRHDAELVFMAVMPYYESVRNVPQLATLLSVVGLSDD